MTPKEKAKELVEKFRLNVLDYEGCSINEHKAKQCALIAVDEILDIIEDDGFTFAEYHDKKTIEYWFEVKQEIEIL
jgi:hypothetical protein